MFAFARAPIVKKITFKKGIDKSLFIAYTYIVKRKEVEWTEVGSEKTFLEKKKFPLDSIAEM